MSKANFAVETRPVIEMMGGVFIKKFYEVFENAYDIYYDANGNVVHDDDYQRNIHEEYESRGYCETLDDSYELIRRTLTSYCESERSELLYAEKKKLSVFHRYRLVNVKGKPLRLGVEFCFYIKEHQFLEL